MNLKPKELTGAAMLVLIILGVALLVIVVAAVIMYADGKSMPEKLLDLAPMIVTGLLGILARTQPDKPADSSSESVTVTKSPAG